MASKYTQQTCFHKGLKNILKGILCRSPRSFAGSAHNEIGQFNGPESHLSVVGLAA